MTFYLKCMQDEVTETVSEVSEKSLGERLVYISAFDLIFDVLYKLDLRWHVFVIISTMPSCTLWSFFICVATEEVFI